MSHKYNHNTYKHPRCEALERLTTLSSLGTTTPVGGKGHDLDCFDSSGKLIQFKGTQHRIFSTAPTKGELCAITLTFVSDPNEEEGAKTEVYCGDPKDLKDASPNVLPDPEPESSEND